MKKIQLYPLFFILIMTGNQTVLIAQKEFGRAGYLVKLAEDRFPFEALLEFTSSESIFKYKQQNTSKWFVEENPDDELSAFQIVYTDTSGHAVYRNFESEKILVRSFCSESEPILYHDHINFTWTIVPGLEKINSIECQKATAKFRGREYTAWFAPSIPVNAGPWKFFGLPGLITQVADKTNEVFITLKSFSFSQSTNVNLAKLKGELWTKEKFFDCLDSSWEIFYFKNKANIARLQAEFPELEISDNNLSKTRPATEY